MHTHVHTHTHTHAHTHTHMHTCAHTYMCTHTHIHVHTHTCTHTHIYMCTHTHTSVRQTKVIDDEMDYFSVDTNQWLSEQERMRLRKREEELREQRHGSRRNKAVTLDFAGRRVMEEESKVGQWANTRAHE